MNSYFAPFLVSFLVSGFLGLLIVVTRRVHGRLTYDDAKIGIHKYHKSLTPRVGGIAFFVGLAAGGAYHGFEADNALRLAKWAGIAAMPVFLGGFFEDITKRVTARDRLLLSFLSATIAYFELKVGLVRTDWLWFDQFILAYPGISLLLTILMMGGVAHAANIVDGFNGLLLGVSILALTSFILVGIRVDAALLLIYMLIMLGALLGTFCINFPKGRLFLGDGGAYLIGFLLALFALLLVKKFDRVSPWFPLLVLIYPVFETVFSIYRKKVIRKRSAMAPDRLHLHMLVYRKLSSRVSVILKVEQNPATAILMWIIAVIPMIPAVIWWDRSDILILCTLLFALGYVACYRWVLRL